MSGKLKKQRNMFRIKGQDKNFRKILNEKEIHDLHDKKFKISNKYAHQCQNKTWKWEFQETENKGKYSTEMMKLKNTTTVLTNMRVQKQTKSKTKDQWTQRQGSLTPPTRAAKRKRNKKEQR